MGFFIGRKLGLPFLERIARRFPAGEKRLLVGEYLFLRHGGKIVFWGRFVALLRVLAAVLAGANKMPWRRFALMNALGGLCWATFFSTTAFAFGDIIRQIEGPLGITLLGVSLAGILLALVLFRRYEQRIVEHTLTQIQFTREIKAARARRFAPPRNR